MKIREQRIGELLARLRRKSHGFLRPPMLVIGGYALRAFVPFARYSRDCDLCVAKQEPWAIDQVARWFPRLTVEAMEKADTFAYLRLTQLAPLGKRRIRISLDVMEGEIRGRYGEVVRIDPEFVSKNAQETTIEVGDHAIPIRIPSYRDYFLLKLASARPSDIRDLAALVWQQGIPRAVGSRARSIVQGPRQLLEKLALAIADLEEPRFRDSWRGTFMTGEFSEDDKMQVLRKLRRLQQSLPGQL